MCLILSSIDGRPESSSLFVFLRATGDGWDLDGFSLGFFGVL